ncbi:hypothetical protein KFL_000090470 [Klebsormidium nitens]|uniref:Uncharacterized protein n=1 Tax=Klebsormidium nitens TaxID=105231 RepID=A0A1Y1HMH4_KLENI|nr:hypothetical protein KFL_000090470 [Klebsormidium nitens]|eukprot:GAQ78201.1 hypothetical protein KFL_000090470 [Klebsormidium nitens]
MVAFAGTTKGCEGVQRTVVTPHAAALKLEDYLKSTNRCPEVLRKSEYMASQAAMRRVPMIRFRYGAKKAGGEVSQPSPSVGATPPPAAPPAAPKSAALSSSSLAHGTASEQPQRTPLSAKEIAAVELGGVAD